MVSLGETRLPPLASSVHVTTEETKMLQCTLHPVSWSCACTNNDSRWPRQRLCNRVNQSESVQAKSYKSKLLVCVRAGGGRAHGRRRVSPNTIAPCAQHNSQPVETYKTQPGSFSFWDAKVTKSKSWQLSLFMPAQPSRMLHKMSAQELRTRHRRDLDTFSALRRLSALRHLCLSSRHVSHGSDV